MVGKLLKSLVMISILVGAGYIGLTKVPMESMAVGDCTSQVIQKRLSMRNGDSIESAAAELGAEHTCPRVELKLYVL